MFEKAREIADYVVVDTGFCLEADEELSFDTMAPRRNAATLRSLELADTVYAVGAADSIGVPRLVRGLSELEAAVPQAAPRVVLNKVRASAAGQVTGTPARDAWERYGPGGGNRRLPASGRAQQAIRHCCPGASCLRLHPNQDYVWPSRNWFVHLSSENADPLSFLPQRSVG